MNADTCCVSKSTSKCIRVYIKYSESEVPVVLYCKRSTEHIFLASAENLKQYKENASHYINYTAVFRWELHPNPSPYCGTCSASIKVKNEWKRL